MADIVSVQKTRTLVQFAKICDWKLFPYLNAKETKWIP